MTRYGGAVPAVGVGGRAARLRPGLNGSSLALVGEVQRLRILSAMARIACEQGLQSATVTQLVGRAGVSRRRFYELFECREDCFLQAFERALALASERVSAAYELGLGWVGRVRVGMLALLRFCEEEPELARVCVVHALAAGPRTLARRGQVLEQLANVLDEGRLASRAGTQPQPLVADVLLGGVLAVIHARLLESSSGPLTDLLNRLMFVIVLPYQGFPAARRELSRPVPRIPRRRARRAGGRDPLENLEVRLTYRTLRALAAIAVAPGISNRDVAYAAGVRDAGQMSKLLARVQQAGLIRNTGEGQAKGAANAWTLTPRGAEVGRAAGLENGRLGRE
jgi:AcrR family transcriptional regulator